MSDIHLKKLAKSYGDSVAVVARSVEKIVDDEDADAADETADVEALEPASDATGAAEQDAEVSADADADATIGDEATPAPEED